MKNSLKIGALALFVAVSFAACKGSSSNGTSDSDTAKKADTAMSKMAPDTSKKDTSKKATADTSKKAATPAAKDTAKKK